MHRVILLTTVLARASRASMARRDDASDRLL